MKRSCSTSIQLAALFFVRLLHGMRYFNDPFTLQLPLCRLNFSTLHLNTLH